MTGGVLTQLILAPVAAAIVIALLPRASAGLHRTVGLVGSALIFVHSLALLADFAGGAAMQFVERAEWLPAYGVSYHVGIDGLSLWLIILTTFLTPVALLGSWTSPKL